MALSEFLVLFTASYPYDIAAEKTFLDNEVKKIARNFHKVVIVPEFTDGKKAAIPANIEINEGYALLLRMNKRRRIKTLLMAIFSSFFYEDILSRPRILLSPGALGAMISFISQALYARKWVRDFIKREGPSNKYIFYTYWLNHITMGIGLLKKKYPEIRIVSRVHGFDLYEERHALAYIPCRYRTMQLLDGLYSVSEAGQKYMVGKYPWIASFCKVMRLGVKDPEFVAKYSADGVIRLVTCSSLISVKRVDLILEGICIAGQLRPDQLFEWHHFGDGPLSGAIEKKAEKILPSNVKAYFPGFLLIDEIISFYKNNPVDLFINVSMSEGLPISIMEAISCGIPVVATAVGGNPEIVSDRNGILLSPDPTPDEIANAIIEIADNPALAERKRKGSRQVWEEKYNADFNYQVFVDTLKTFVSSGSST